MCGCTKTPINNINTGLEPDGFPTQAYIEKCVLFRSIPQRSRQSPPTLSFCFVLPDQVHGSLHKSEPGHAEERLPTTVPQELVPGPILMGWGFVPLSFSGDSDLWFFSALVPVFPFFICASTSTTLSQGVYLALNASFTIRICYPAFSL